MLRKEIASVRRVFVLLMLLNILFAAWQYLTPNEITLDKNELPVYLSDIRLMQELPGAVAVDVSAVNTEDGLIPPRFFCFTLGPFSDNQVTEEIKQQLREFTEKLETRVIEENELHRYAVYLETKSYDDAVVISKSLAQQSVTDFYIMTKDGKKRVSLGYFKEKAYADKRIQRLTGLGYRPQTETIFRRYQLYWLDYDLNEIQKDRVNELVSPYLQNEISLLSRNCEK